MKQFIVLTKCNHTSIQHWVSIETDDFQKAVTLRAAEELRGNIATIVTQVNFKVLEDSRQLDMFEEAQA